MRHKPETKSQTFRSGFFCLSDDGHFFEQMRSTGKLVNDEQGIADVYTGRTLQLRVVGNVTGQSLVVAVESGTDQALLSH